MKWNSFWIFSLLLISQGASANLAGMSSDLVVCRSKRGKIKKMPVLADRWEAEQILGQKLDPVTGKDYEDMLEQLLKPLQKLSEDRYRGRMRFGARSDRQVQAFPTLDFDTPRSSKLVGLPDDCKAEPAIFERDPRFDGERRYNLNLELWNVIDDATRVELSFRASIAHEAFLQGHEDDRYVRYFVRTWLKAEHPSHTNFVAFLQLLNDSHLEWTDLPTPEAYWGGNVRVRVGRCMAAGCLHYESRTGELPADFTPKTRRAWELYLPKTCNGLSLSHLTPEVLAKWPEECNIDFSLNASSAVATALFVGSEGITFEFGRRAGEGGRFLEDYIFRGPVGSFQVLMSPHAAAPLEDQPGKFHFELSLTR